MPRDDQRKPRRFLAFVLAGLLGCVCLLLMPPGMGVRLQWLIRYVTQPAQAWTDWTARVSRAAIGGDSPEDEAGTMETLRQELATAQLQAKATQASMEAYKFSAGRLGVDWANFRRAYTSALGRVIHRDPLTDYHDTLTLDIGGTDGVKEGQYVVSVPADGQTLPHLVGVVKRTSGTSCVVHLVSHAGVAIPCEIPSRGVDAVLMGTVEPADGVQAEKPALARAVGRLYLAHALSKGQDGVEPGDPVYTSGLGGNVYGVSGIYVGTVAETRLDADGSPQILLEPSEELLNLRHLLVILGRERLP